MGYYLHLVIDKEINISYFKQKAGEDEKAKIMTHFAVEIC